MAQVKASIWEKLRRLVVALLFVVCLAGAVYFYLPLFKQNERYRQRIFELDRQIAQQRRQQRQLEKRIYWVLNDPRTLERLARERLGYARTNETIIRFEPPANP